ncbi:Plasmid stabilization system [Sterolibacterium denitrificans]|uniref:Plasmid stabilization system n=1 Tax=Sterolibacterium denitrificans TaxID=157592 RepID=A0A7Z7HP53_9PROT|nr:type II toxin-antitoxin system RelE/ParE family toxin [Sterolibacterium denitrificans]SMB21163.1 Plasmid stabilization system [Sterolibacterium denitrificans]
MATTNRVLRIRFAEFAAHELSDACDWYEHQQPGLGLRFKRDMRDAVARIARNPTLFPIELDDVRRYVMARFPYALRHVLRGSEVWIVAVSHQHRRPDYWIERIEKS